MKTGVKSGFANLARTGWPIVVFSVVWLAMRIFWLDGDSGIASMWEYGYHVTDEGYYLSGGKERFLWGTFVDLPRGECLTYGYAAGMQWLSYLSHLVFGLSTWAWRIPFVIIYGFAWLVLFRFVSRKSGSLFALATCLSVSLIPLVIVYERTASNDALISAFLVVAYVLARGKGVWRIFAAAVLTGAIVLVKPAVWVLIPIPLAGVLMERKTRSSIVDAVLFVAIAIASAYGFRGLVAWSVVDDAARAGLSPFAVLDRLNAHYGLPDFFDIATDFRAFAAFPRDPTSAALAGVVILLSALPLAMFFRNLLRRKWTGNLLLYFMVPAYVGAVSVMNTLYSHYFLPMVMLIPIVLSAMHEDLSEDAGEPIVVKVVAADILLAAAAILFALHLLSSSTLSSRDVQAAYSRIYNLPQQSVWVHVWVYLAVAPIIGLALLVFRRGMKGLRTSGLGLSIGIFAVVSVSLAAYPAVLMAPFMHTSPDKYFMPLALNFVLGGLLMLLLFIHPEILSRRLAMLLIAPVVVSSAYLVTPSGRAALCELFAPPTHYGAQVAAELAKLVPPDAVVIGERTDQAFLSLPVRTAATFISNSDPIPVIKDLLKRDPKTKLYAFADSQHAYNLQHYQKNAKDFQLVLMKTFKLPSFGTGKLADVHLCRIIDRRSAAHAN